jgi:hypothetical protein
MVPLQCVPVCLGRMTPRMRELTEFGLEAHLNTIGWLKAGVVASAALLTTLLTENAASAAPATEKTR